MNTTRYPLNTGPVPRENEGILTWEQIPIISRAMMMGQSFFSLLGIATNTINLCVFAAQGIFHSSTNISFFSLSFFDLCSCLLMASIEIILLLSFFSPILWNNWYTVYTIRLSSVYTIFYHCGNWTTVYLSVERAFCVMFPLKVKAIFRPKVTIIVIASIFSCFFSSQMPTFILGKTVEVFDATTNQTYGRLKETPVAKSYLYYRILIESTILSSVALIVVATTTALMINSLNKFRKWRHQHQSTTTGSSSGKDLISSKEAEMVKSVIVVTCIFLFCLSTAHVPATVILSIPGATLTGKNINLLAVVFNVRFLLGVVNSSINFFFYIRISSQYKAAFTKTFGKQTKHM